MKKKLKSEIKSNMYSEKLLAQIDDKRPHFSMMLLAWAIIENCFLKKYQFRTFAMENRLNNHGALPKSFFRQNFLRCTKLMNLMKLNNLDIDQLLEKSLFWERLEEIVIFDRNENKSFYKLLKEIENE